MYYICRISDNWIIHDGTKNKSRPLTAEETEFLKKLFSSVVKESGKFMSAFKVEPIAPNRLSQLDIVKA